MSDAEQQSTVSQVGSWIWGTIEGGFNEQQSISQIIVDAIIGMIPLVGDVTAVRDLVAVILRLVEHPEKRQDKLEWLTLVLLLFALIPVFGGVIKGVGRLVIKAGEEVGKHAEIVRDIIQLLNRLGEGDAVKFFRALDFEKYTAELAGQWSKLTQRLDDVIGGVLRRARFVIPDGMVKRLEQLQTGIRDLKQIGERMIPDSLKELNQRLKTLQKHVYEGDWHEIPDALKSATRETEARLVEKEVEGKPSKAWELHDAPHPPDGANMYHHVEGWPNLKKPPWTTKDAGARIIATFSGPIRPVKIPAGTKIRRVVTQDSKKAGAFWTYELARDGKSWRENCAVLDSWSSDGFYLELTVPEGGIWAWEGKIASQIENDAKRATFGQFLPGGATQIFIDFDFPAHAGLRNIVDNKLKRILTNWTDHTNLNVPEKTVTVQKLGVNEIAPKSAAETGAAAGQRALRAEESNDQQRQTGDAP